MRISSRRCATKAAAAQAWLEENFRFIGSRSTFALSAARKRAARGARRRMSYNGSASRRGEPCRTRRRGSVAFAAAALDRGHVRLRRRRVSHETDPRPRRRRGRRTDRPHVARRHAEALRAGRADDRHRQPRRRRRHDRDAPRGAKRAGRLHAALQQQPVRGGAEPLQDAGLRSVQGLRAHHQRRLEPEHHLREPVGEREEPAGADRARQNAEDHLRIGGRGQHAASHRRAAAETAGEARRHAHSLQQRGACDTGGRGRPGADRHHRHAADRRAHQERQAPRHRRHEPRAHAFAARTWRPSRNRDFPGTRTTRGSPFSRPPARRKTS